MWHQPLRLVGADDRRVSAELGATLDQEFLNPRLSQIAPSSSNGFRGHFGSRCVLRTCLVAGGGFEPPTFGL